MLTPEELVFSDLLIFMSKYLISSSKFDVLSKI